MQQTCDWAYVAFADESVADFFDDQIDAGRHPAEFARIWLHTHPGDCPEPSAVDEETFASVFGSTDWSVMFILARGGASYARLRLNGGLSLDVKLRVEVDYSAEFPASDLVTWEAEYHQHVQQQVAVPRPRKGRKRGDIPMELLPDDDTDWLFGIPDTAERDDEFSLFT
ncbi:MAG: hypothetical protein KDA88_02150 [Planctomycetaceae bacterium]|nr:hypothetical protein [Planctomycetaceae bacterium]